VKPTLIITTLAVALAAVPAALCADPLVLGPIEERDVLSGKIALDAATGYILSSSSFRQAATLLRVPDGATREAYQQDWEKAFAKAQKRYKSEHASWEATVKSAPQTGAKIGPEPEEPTREKFTIGAIDLRDQTGFGPMFVYNKAEKSFTYLTRVKPGTYIYYGPIAIVPGTPVLGACYCMGTVKFEVKAGAITDIGNFLFAAPRAEPPYDVMTANAIKAAAERAAKKGAQPEMAGLELAYGIPDSLKSWPAAKAEFSASGKLNNYFGIFVSRMPPIPGILAYRRDTVVDARTNTDVPNPPIMTQVRIKK
jgi:hypothetical protein